MLEWTARVRCSQSELGRSFSVILFIGNVPDDPEQWVTSSSCVGFSDVYADSNSHKDNGEDGVQDFVVLNDGLLNHFAPSQLTPEVVALFLKTELHWRVHNVSMFQ